MRYIKVLFIVILFFFLLVFFVQNTGVLSTKLSFKFNLFNWNWQSSPVPVYIYILLAFVAGALISMLYFLLDKLRQSKELKQYKTRVQKLEKDLSSSQTSASQAISEHASPGTGISGPGN